MIAVLSPAKSLDYESALATTKRSEPRMLESATELVTVMRAKSPADLESLMSLSPALAQLNYERFRDWAPDHANGGARPALLAFDGDVYRGLGAAAGFRERDYTDAQKTLRILSGLYGLLRPLDAIRPYRLEMGTKLQTAHEADLYAFWGESITDALAQDLQASPGSPALVNLASNEYFAAVRVERLGARVVTPTFLDSKDGGEPRIVSFYAKRARGAMAGWIVRQRIRSVRALSEFDGLGYRYDSERSARDAPVFVRAA